MESQQNTTHTVEKIGGTSMSRFPELKDNLFLRKGQSGTSYGRIFVVSAYGGMTDLLLEHKKNGKDGVYSLFCQDDSWDWGDALSKVLERMLEINVQFFHDENDRQIADHFVKERVEGVRSCLLDLQRLCSFGHFQLHQHLSSVREMLSALGEAHSAHNLTLLLKGLGLNARFVDLSGWREEEVGSLDQLVQKVFADINLEQELPIVTGYAHCREGLVETYDRGYTEITMSRIAILTGAKEAIIHKEYHLSSADPRLVGVDKAQPIGRTNYDVADQLSDLGMEAIHPGAGKGLREAGIPLRIRHSFEPDHPGTLISSGFKSLQARPEIIAGQAQVTALMIHDQAMVGRSDSDARLCRVISKSGLRYLAKDTNANTLTHYFHASLGRVEKLVKLVEDEFEGADIEIDKVAVVSMVGSNMAISGILARSSSALARAGINILAVHQNMRQVDLRFIVSKDDFEQALGILHQEWMESKEERYIPQTMEAVAAS